MIRSNRSGRALALALVILALAVAGPAAAGKKKRSRDSGVACAILDAPLDNGQVAAAVDSALASVPGTVESVAFRMGHAADGSEVVFLAVVVRDAAGDLHSFYFDGETGDPLVPPTPTVAFQDAMASAVALVQSLAGGLAEPQVLSGKLVNEVVNPLYVFKIVSPEERVVAVAVDAQTGEARVVDDHDDRSRRGKRGRLRCEDSDSGSDSDESDSDDSDSDSDSDGDDSADDSSDA